MSTNIALVGIALGLVLLNGFFVAAEFSLVKLRETRARAIARNYGWRGQMLLKVHRDLDAYLSACQLGITLASLGLGWIGEPAFAELLRPSLIAAGIESEAILHAVAFAVAFSIISYLHIVVGELAPKSMAIRLTEPVGTWTAAPLYGFYWLMYPAIWLLNHSSNWLLGKLGLDVTRGYDSRYSKEELKLILRSSRADTDFTAEEWQILAQALDFRDLEVSDLMRPFNEVIALSCLTDASANIDRMVTHRFSRYPYLDVEGRVSGIIHLKDVFFAMRRGTLPESLDDLCRTVPVILADVSVTELFRRFQRGEPHFAVVVRHDERPVGFITLDNLLGALVGEIRDEFRGVGNDWKKLEDGSLIGKGSLPLFTLERALGVDIEKTEAESIGGLVVLALGDFPSVGQHIRFEHFDVVVKRMEGPRILLVRVHPHPPLAID